MRLPDISHRVMVCGRTGSGKTVFGAWLLSKAPFDKIPYVIINHKGDSLLSGLPRVKPLELKDKLPKEPGVYQMFPGPHQEAQLEAWLWRLWRKGRTGIMLDEGYMVPKLSPAFRTVLTQGRSLGIPAILLSQRPSFISRFVVSEADFYCAFHLNDERDQDTIRAFTPQNDPAWQWESKLEKYWSRWYDVADDFSALLRPIPGTDMIEETFEERLKPKRRWL